MATVGGPHCGAVAGVDADGIGPAQIGMRLWSPSDDPDGPVGASPDLPN